MRSLSGQAKYPAGEGEWGPNDRAIAHIDMDAFFASVEILDFPELKDKPVIVGVDSDRGVVAAASYKAREYGIHSAMPIFQARKRCSSLIIRPGRMKRYLEISRVVIRLLNRFSPLVEQVSIDEAFIDLTGTGRLLGRPERTIAAIREEIWKNTGLTSSVGLSTSKLVAKIASDIDKPDGMTVIPPLKVREFLDLLPIGKVPGVGKKGEEQLRKIGIKFLGEIRSLSPEYISASFGKFGSRLVEIAEGNIASPVIPYSQPKSISNELTLGEDTADFQVLEKHLLALSEKVGRRLRENDFRGRTITLKLKDFEHKQITRSRTLDRPACQGKIIFTEARKLLVSCRLDTKKRLIGVGVSNLEPLAGCSQYSLFGEKSAEEERWDRVDKAVDDITRMFGSGTVKRGRLHEGS
ncbi:MAG: DNA polymerase IV [Candidatus Krumholzibacteriota bacterium]|nr:DNA polymerase IV [Candidatus Krumholzibacteriota bacterium]